LQSPFFQNLQQKNNPHKNNRQNNTENNQHNNNNNDNNNIDIERNRRIIKNRSLLVDGAIVNVMKRLFNNQQNNNENDEISFENLFNLIKKKLNYYFDLEKDFFKERIEYLIDNDFIYRDDSDKNIFYYNP
jgi:hypothetical protein